MTDVRPRVHPRAGDGEGSPGERRTDAAAARLGAYGEIQCVVAQQRKPVAPRHPERPRRGSAVGQGHRGCLVERVGAVGGRALPAYGVHHGKCRGGGVVGDALDAQERRSAGSAGAASGTASLGSLLGSTKR